MVLPIDTGRVDISDSMRVPTVLCNYDFACSYCMQEGCETGKNGGIQVGSEASPNRPTIVSILHANARSLDNKLDYIRLMRAPQHYMMDCLVFVFVETWQNDNIPDTTIQPERLRLAEMAYVFISSNNAVRMVW